MKKLLLIAMVLFLSSCGNEEVKEEIASLKKDITALSSKLDRINDAIKKINTNSGSKNNQPKPKADPNAVYNIPVSGSVVKGNKNAPITITYFTDFQ